MRVHNTPRRDSKDMLLQASLAWSAEAVCRKKTASAAYQLHGQKASGSAWMCRRDSMPTGRRKIAKVREQTEYAAPITTDAILARWTDEERTCSFRAQRCQREERHVHTEASHFSQPAAWD